MNQRCSLYSALFVIGLVAIGISASWTLSDATKALGGGDVESELGEATVPVSVESVRAKLPAAEPGTVTATPKRIDEVLTNPGMGFASFHFGWW